MSTLLQIKSSLNSDAGQSSRLADAFVAAWRGANPGGRVVVRDLAREPIPHLTAARFGAFTAKPEARTAEERDVVQYSDMLIDELRAADVIVLGVPMYNFGVPAPLKNWIDAISRAGVTFRYAATGPEGLLKGKKVYVALTRGGKYRNTPADTQVPYLKTVLTFLGLTDVHFVYAEGLSMGVDAEHSAIASAYEQIEEAVTA